MPECDCFLGLSTHTDTLHYYSWGLFKLRCSVKYNTPKLKVPLFWYTPAKWENEQVATGSDGKCIRHVVCLFDVLSFTTQSTRGMMHYWKEDGISTSTLNTFRKKLLCRCLVLVFTTVRFQSAMLGKCFSFSQQHNVLFLCIIPLHQCKLIIEMSTSSSLYVFLTLFTVSILNGDISDFSKAMTRTTQINTAASYTKLSCFP